MPKPVRRTVAEPSRLVPAGDVRPTVTLYGRPGCHLCDEARAAILALDEELGGLELREIDIEGDERLLAAYLERIPVVAIGDEIVSELALDPHELRERLHTVGRERRDD